MRIIGVLALLFAWSPVAASPCALRVGWEEWSPYIQNEAGVFSGPEYEGLARLADAADCSLIWVEAPWARALRLLAAGDVDILYAAGFSEERTRFAKFSIPYRKEGVVLVRRRGETGKKAYVSLAGWLARSGDSGGKTIGVIRGNYYGDRIAAILADPDVVGRLRAVRDDALLIAMLGRGRIDGYLVEAGLLPAHHERSRVPIAAVEMTEHFPEPLHYMFDRDTPADVISRFNRAIAADLRANTQGD